MNLTFGNPNKWLRGHIIWHGKNRWVSIYIGEKNLWYQRHELWEKGKWMVLNNEIIPSGLVCTTDNEAWSV